MNRLTVLATFIAITCPCLAEAQCLAEAGDFAERICGEVKQTGKSTLITGKGDLTAAAKGLIAKALGQLGGDVGVDIQTNDFENVLQEQLAGELINVRQCGTQMATLAINQVCTKAPHWKVCSNQAFGLDHWEDEAKLTGATGWRGGGYNPEAYCTDFINAVLNSRSLGDKPHDVTDIKSSEERRRTGLLRDHAEYNYHCTINLHWNPVYKQKSDPICGQE
ncbi:MULTISPECIES: hypothetical protein [Mesorhizobium]|uniref:Uncharacterized protein n=2 Tax=Mesorhizobium TaxID=68287 RepID=A0ABU4Z714_9HYPH|nr:MULTISPECIES: hypothetical protein [unclassified Mesorhizobium]MDX8481611.1 hypothetical protein [Mesorhizobium sp. VK24D]MDX8494706.1 hypothetical protein [Mesorhizobium sp. VK22B]MDX8515884.1 hypothetical protein [Mesorhizobium sp. VK23E]